MTHGVRTNEGGLDDGAGGSAADTPYAVVVPGERRYPDLISGMNQRWQARPDAVHLVTTAAQIVDVVRDAVHRGSRLTVRGGGHCYEDFVYDDTVRTIIDMSRMRRVYFDEDHAAVAVEGGATLLDTYERMYEEWGVTVPGGICHSVGVGGHVAGGGWGLLCREHGLIVDHLYAVEVVVVDADGEPRVVVATREPDDPNRELWWAHTGGGGGNFGVVVRYLFRSPGAQATGPETALFSPPSHVLLNAITLPWDELTREGFTSIVRNYGAWHVANREPGTRSTALASFLDLNHRSNGHIGITTQVDASESDAEAVLAEYIDFVTAECGVRHRPMSMMMGDRDPLPQFFHPRRLPWFQATRVLGLTNGTLNDPSLRADYKSAYMRSGFPEEHLDVLWKYLSSTDIDNSTIDVVLSSFGGQVNAVAPDATAFPHRETAFKMYWQILWTDAADDDKNVDWLRRFYGELYAATGGVPVPDETTDGCYLNYADIDLSDPRFNRSDVSWHELYYKDNYPRLQQVKARWDPRDVFHHRQSVELPR